MDAKHWTMGLLTCVLAARAAIAQPGADEKLSKSADKKVEKTADPKKSSALPAANLDLAPDTRNSQTEPIDLASALRLAGLKNIDLELAREQANLALSQRRLVVAQWLPNLNGGASLNHHLGPLQAAAGNINDLHRDSAMAGLGVGAVGAGTPPVPGLVWSGNLSNTIYQNLISKQIVALTQFRAVAVENETFLRVASAYIDLQKAAGKRAVAVRVREEAREVARITGNFAKVGQGRQADAERAASEFESRNGEVLQGEQEIGVASARLNQLLRLDPTLRLEPTETSVLPEGLLPDTLTLPELIGLALTHRAELQERQAAIQAALYELHNAKRLPFSPTMVLAYSAATFGGGSDLSRDAGRPRFGDFSNRQDFDAVMYWTLRNLGVGNLAQVRLTQSQLRTANLQELAMLDRIKAEVSLAYVRTRTRYQQIEIAEKAVESSTRAFQGDVIRTKNREGLPIEVINSLRLLGRSRSLYLESILEHNRAQFELYGAVGMPNPSAAARSLPERLLATANQAPSQPEKQGEPKKAADPR